MDGGRIKCGRTWDERESRRSPPGAWSNPTAVKVVMIRDCSVPQKGKSNRYWSRQLLSVPPQKSGQSNAAGPGAYWKESLHHVGNGIFCNSRVQGAHGFQTAHLPPVVVKHCHERSSAAELVWIPNSRYWENLPRLCPVHDPRGPSNGDMQRNRRQPEAHFLR